MNKIYRGRTAKEFYLASLLYDSIEDQNICAVKSLITTKQADANIVLPRKGISPFHLAVGGDSIEFALNVAKLILQHGGNPNVRSDEGLTPLHIAAAWDRYDMVHLLLLSGADPELRDINHKTAMDYAYEQNNTDILQMLRKCTTDQHSVFNKEEKDAYSLVLDKICIDNGASIHEFEILDNYNPSSLAESLQKLPKTNTEDYVRTWCNTQLSLTSQSERQSSNTSVLEECDSIGSSLPESLEIIEFKKPTDDFVTYRKKDPKKSDELDVSSFVFDKCRKLSRESGILTLPDSALDFSDEKDDLQKTPFKENEPAFKINASSDYCTCDSSSVNILEVNVIESSTEEHFCDETKNKTPENEQNTRRSLESSDLSFVTVSEVYKYKDTDEGIVLFEKRLLKKQASDLNETIISATVSSESSLPITFDYDTDTLRKELTLEGFEPGPITPTTKRVYIKKLIELKRNPSKMNNCSTSNERVYSEELQKTLQNSSWFQNLSKYKNLEETLCEQFNTPDPSRKWREGVNKSSFTYLLLDPRITRNLPYRAETLSAEETWKTFLSSIFYVGKGKRSRPYAHLYEAVDAWKQNQMGQNKKIRHILEIWNDKYGVVCLHVYQNIIPVEAYTREAAMISALELGNVSNMKMGEFYGVCATWPMKQKKKLGVYLLYKALQIFLHEGERQLCPGDID